MKNFESKLTDLYTVKDELYGVVILTEYNLDYGDVQIGDSINGEYKILEKSKVHEFLHGFARKKEAYKIRKIMGS